LELNDNNKPFLLGISTIETHTGFKPTGDNIEYADGNNNTLNMIHNFDHAFGLFWNYFKNSKYHNNTVIILTGDHASYISRDYMKAVGKGWNFSVYDQLSMVIYDPIHHLHDTLHVNATSVALAPTVLQLAEIDPSQQNAFMGTSLLDSNHHDAAFGISPYSDYQVYFRTGKHMVNNAPNKIHDEEDKKTVSSLRKILNYHEYLRKTGRLYPAQVELFQDTH
jgi:phosphoglycerol transferase MdoB-like AlkP superfamily enzyme